MIKNTKDLIVGDVFNVSEGQDYSGNKEGHYTIVDKDNQLNIVAIQPYVYVMEADGMLFVLCDAGNGNYNITHVVDLKLKITSNLPSLKITTSTTATIVDAKVKELFRSLHQYAQNDYITSYDEESKELQIDVRFEHSIDEMIDDHKRLSRGEDEEDWINVDDEFTMEQLECAKIHFEHLRQAGLTAMYVEA